MIMYKGLCVGMCFASVALPPLLLSKGLVTVAHGTCTTAIIAAFDVRPTFINFLFPVLYKAKIGEGGRLKLADHYIQIHNSKNISSQLDNLKIRTVQ